MSRALAVAALLLAFAPAARADHRLGDGRLGRVRLGWGDLVPRAAPAPIAVSLVNPDGLERAIRVAVTAEGHGAEQTVVLAPGARKRIGFALLVGSEVSVSLSEGAKVLAYERFSVRSFLHGHVLLVDGEPGTLAVPEVVSGAVAIPATLDEVPDEVACLSRFEAVVLRNVDVLRLDAGARAALDEMVRAGGTVVVSSSPDRAGVARFFEEAPGPEDRTGPFPVKRRGLGRIVNVPGDLGAPTAEGQAHRALVATALASAAPWVYPPLVSEGVTNSAARRAVVLAVVFVAAYLIVVSPGFAVALRRARPGRVARALGVALALATVAGALVAGTLRAASSRVLVHSFTLARPGAGDPVVLATVLVQSGGRRALDLEVEGRDVAVTAFRSGGFMGQYRGRPFPIALDARTRRGDGRTVRIHAPVAPFGDASFAVIATAPALPALEARVVGSAVLVSNPTGRPTGPALVRSLLERERLAVVPPLQPGGRLTVPIAVRDSWKPPLELAPLESGATLGWPVLRARSDDRVPLGFVVVAEDEPRFTVRAAGADVEHHAYRVAEVPAPKASEPGWIGVEVTPALQGAVVSKVTPGSPADASRWYFRPGRTVASVAGVSVRTQEDLDGILAHVGPGVPVPIVLGDGATVEVGTVERPDAPRKPRSPR